MRGQQNISMCVILIYKILSKLHLYKIETFLSYFLLISFGFLYNCTFFLALSLNIFE